MITAVSETLQASKFILNSELDKNKSGYMEVSLENTFSSKCTTHLFT
jgi:hypothetical protein